VGLEQGNKEVTVYGTYPAYHKEMGIGSLEQIHSVIWSYTEYKIGREGGGGGGVNERWR
jgi:hypothetical protein